MIKEVIRLQEEITETTETIEWRRKNGDLILSVIVHEDCFEANGENGGILYRNQTSKLDKFDWNIVALLCGKYALNEKKVDQLKQAQDRVRMACQEYRREAGFVTIEETIRPYSCRDQEIMIGQVVDEKFHPYKKIDNAKSWPIKVVRREECRGAQTDVTYRIEVPGNYDYAIAVRTKIEDEYQYEVVFQPVPVPEPEPSTDETQEEEEEGMRIEMNNETYVDSREVCTLLGTSRTTLDRMIKTGKLTAYRRETSNRNFFKLKDVENFQGFTERQGAIR